MSKLIVEMEMPRFCAECPMCDNVYYGDDVRKSFCVVFDERKEILTEDRPSWCPIVGVLPDEHGDLIDRDELFETIKSRVALVDSCPEGKPSMKELFERDVLCVCLHDVVCAKAVIEAERKDDERTDKARRCHQCDG